MYQNLIRSLSKIVQSEDKADIKLMKIQAILDFASQQPTLSSPPVPPSTPPTVQQPRGSGAIVGIENV